MQWIGGGWWVQFRTIQNVMRLTGLENTSAPAWSRRLWRRVSSGGCADRSFYISLVTLVEIVSLCPKSLARIAHWDLSKLAKCSYQKIWQGQLIWEEKCGLPGSCPFKRCNFFLNSGITGQSCRKLVCRKCTYGIYIYILSIYIVYTQQQNKFGLFGVKNCVQKV